MKLVELYIPVFEEKKGTVRRLRADFGSRRTELQCTNCEETFTRRVGPNTSGIKCPACGHNRVKLALSEKAKKKVVEMKEALEDEDHKRAADLSLEILSDLVGDNRPHVIPTIHEALAGLAAVEPGLGNKIRQLASSTKEGKGRDDLSKIATKMGFEKHFQEKK